MNNSDGTVTSIFDIILGNTNVSTPGTFILINLTMINSSGSSEINIKNVEISDPNGFLIAVNVTNGTINAKMATNVLPEMRFINGTVMDSINKTGIAGVTVSTNTSLYTTNATGFYSLALAAGTYDLTAKFDPRYFTNYTINVSTFGSAVVVQDIELTKKPTGMITGGISNWK